MACLRPRRNLKQASSIDPLQLFCSDSSSRAWNISAVANVLLVIVLATLKVKKRNYRQSLLSKSFQQIGLWFGDPGRELKTPQARKHEKITKKLQNAPRRVGPQNIWEKHRKIRKWPFRIFSAIFFVFSGPHPGWGISLFFFSYFFRIFSYFSCLLYFSVFVSYSFRISGLEGFFSSIPGSRNQKNWFVWARSMILLQATSCYSQLVILGQFIVDYSYSSSRSHK